MNLETELRTAMAEHVRDVAAAPGLIDGVRRRHRRRTVRNRALTGAVIATAAVAAIPFLVSKGSGTEPEPPGGQRALAPPARTLPAEPPTARLCPADSAPAAEGTRPGQPLNGKANAGKPMGPQITSIEGVQVGYLPAHVADLGGEQTGADPATKSWAYGITWSDAKSDTDANATMVGVMVLCGPEARGAGLFDGMVGWQRDAAPVSIQGHSGRRETGHAAWLLRPGVAIDVQVSRNVDLDKVIAGIKVTG